jgi:hypothetical protein
VATLLSESWLAEASACLTLTVDRNKYYLRRRHGAKFQPCDASWADGAKGGGQIGLLVCPLCME